MRMENGESFNLMALYTSTKHEREAFRQQQQEERQLQANRMLQAQAMDVEEGNAKHYELRPAIRELARTLDAVVFVVDASAKASTSKSCRDVECCYKCFVTKVNFGYLSYLAEIFEKKMFLFSRSRICRIQGHVEWALVTTRSTCSGVVVCSRVQLFSYTLH